MIYIFSSAYYEQFKQNVLNASCFPDGHVMRLRYDAKYVEPAVRNDPSSINGGDAVLVFAEGSVANREAVKNGGQLRDYQFYPLRRCTVSLASSRADIINVDVKLGSFVDYKGNNDGRQNLWDGEIKANALRPWPKGFRKGTSDEGLYLFCAESLPFILDRRDHELAWRSVVERVNESELKECITYRVLGFYRRGWWAREKLIEPTVDGSDSLYEFRSSETIFLKLLFFGDANRRGDPKSLKLEFDLKAFTSASLSTILVNGHYNEERILLPCARTTEPVITTLALVQNEPKAGIWSPQPAFMVRVAPFGPYLFLVLAMVALSFFLASLDKFSELWNEINWCNPASIGDHLAKVAGALLFFAAMWLFVRKFPLS
jgi:hypothetical protein